jgi:hypothetical protein
MSNIVPLRTGPTLECDRCGDIFVGGPVRPGVEESIRLAVHTQHDPHETGWASGGLPEGNLCPVCLGSYCDWWGGALDPETRENEITTHRFATAAEGDCG